MLLFKLCDIFFSNHLSHSLAAEWVCGLFPPQLFVLLKKGVHLSKMSKIRKLLEQQVSIHADWYQQNNQTKLSRKKKERERRKRTFTSSRSSGCTLWIIASVSESVRTRAIDTPASVIVFFLLWNFSIFHVLVVAAADIFRQCHQLFQTIGIHMTAVGLLRLYTKYLEWHSPVAGAKALCLQASFQSLANEVLNRQEVKIWAEIMFPEHLLRPCCAFWGRQQATRACSWESYKCKILFFDIPNTDVEHKICTYDAARAPTSCASRFRVFSATAERCWTRPHWSGSCCTPATSRWIPWWNSWKTSPRQSPVWTVSFCTLTKLYCLPRKKIYINAMLTKYVT